VVSSHGRLDPVVPAIVVLQELVNSSFDLLTHAEFILGHPRPIAPRRAVASDRRGDELRIVERSHVISTRLLQLG
jgi:hypothetical protein